VQRRGRNLQVAIRGADTYTLLTAHINRQLQAGLNRATYRRPYINCSSNIWNIDFLNLRTYYAPGIAYCDNGHLLQGCARRQFENSFWPIIVGFAGYIHIV